jgi:hypothetical protein
MNVVGRHQDQPALYRSRIQLAGEFADHDRALILVAVIASFQDHRRAGPVRNHRDRDTRHAPGIVMRRVRNADEADLPARLVEIDAGEGVSVVVLRSVEHGIRLVLAAWD